MASRKIVSVVDDDESVRESLPDLLRSHGFDARPFESAEAFLASDDLRTSACLVLDVSMPGMSGPDLQAELVERGIGLGIVFITAHADATVEALVRRHGAVAFLLKPFTEDAVVGAVQLAVDRE